MGLQRNLGAVEIDPDAKVAQEVATQNSALLES
jgi:hypothetical protein